MIILMAATAHGQPATERIDPASSSEPRYEEGLIQFPHAGDDAVAASGSGAVPADAGFAGGAAASWETSYTPLPSVTALAAGIEALREGLDLAAEDQPTAAAAEFSRAGDLLPHMEDWAHILTARAFVEGGDTAAVRRHLEPIVGSRAAEWAWRVQYDALLQAHDTAAAIVIADRAASAAETAAERAVALARSGTLRITRRDGAGLDDLRAAMRTSASTAGGLAAARAAHDLPDLTPEDRLLVGRTLLAHGGTDRGVAMLEAYAASTTNAAGRAAALLDGGRALFNARHYEDASRTLRNAANVEPEAAFLFARALYRQGRHEQGTEAFMDVVRRHSSSDAAADALFLLGDLAHDDGRVEAAVEYYRQAIASGAHSVSATDAAVRLAGVALLKGDGALARQEIETYLRTRPRDRLSAPALYWLGRAHLALGQHDSASELFQQLLDLDPFSYYGMLAAERLGTSLRDLRLPEPPRISPELARGVEHGLARIDVLREVGLDEEADLELARLRDEFADRPQALYPIAEYLLEGATPMSGALLARDIERIRGSWDDRLLRIVYPLPHRDIIVREARQRGLDPFEVAGLIRQESFFNPQAVSAAGAVGLMQVMPRTASGIAGRAGISGFRSSMLRDPAINMRLGTLFLADQIERWEGRFTDVLGSYNAGPNRVARWRTFPEHWDDEIYIERIPIAETRDYVKRVKLNAAIYDRLYGDTTP